MKTPYFQAPFRGSRVRAFAGLAGFALAAGLRCGGDPAPPSACTDLTASTACDDGDPCTRDGCEAGFCRHDAVADGEAPEQLPGDCARTLCRGGASETVLDAGDAEDDREPCTLDACELGGPTHEPLLDGVACQLSGKAGTCEQGVCVVPCSADIDCDDYAPCSLDACLPEGRCAYDLDALEGDAVPGAAQKPGDCRSLRCVGGEEKEVPDDSDVFDDRDDCTRNTCAGGDPVREAFSCEAPLWCGGGGDEGACGCVPEAVAGPRGPGKAVNDGSVGYRIWEEREHVFLPDGMVARVTGMSGKDVSTYLKTTDFHLQVPDAATIRGIQVDVRRWGLSGGGVIDHAARLVKGGLIGKADRSRPDDWPGTLSEPDLSEDPNFGYVSYGGPSDLWGETWTPADVNHPDFGFALAARYSHMSGNDWAHVDHVRVRVFFTVACP